LFDTCVLKEAPSLIGIILRTYHDFNSHEPIADCLIVSHVPVPELTLESFLHSGIPPKGTVFVRWSRQEYGHSLVAESDIHLVSRTFGLDDTVKRHSNDDMIGTAISISDSYILEPICFMMSKDGMFRQGMPQEGNGKNGKQHSSFFGQRYDVHVRDCDAGCPNGLPRFISHPLHHALLYDVPGDELKAAEVLEPGDYVVERDYLGTVQDNDIDAVLLLDNNTVVMVENPWELELVVPDLDRPLVALPELDDIRRPDVLAYHVGGKAFIPTEHLSRGQHVTTNHRNLRNGRWLCGSYDPTCSPQGHVLDIRTRRAHVRWLCPNPYVPCPFGDRPPSSVRPYDNLGSYNNPRDLRRTKGLTVLERGQRPPQSKDNAFTADISTGQDLEAGDQVRFRDPTGAFVKYQGNGHGQYNRLSRDETFGFDMNEFIVVYSKQKVQVRWQDGSTTEEPSVALKPSVMPEQDICPGDIVTMKDGTRQFSIGESEKNATPFNEMIYFEGDFVLVPERVGVIQSVNARERLAQVRWFVEPSIRLLQQGHILQSGSFFGPVSENVEDVSLYEVMSHAALVRKRRDIVILPPQKPPREAVEAVSRHATCGETNKFGCGPLSWTRRPPGMDMWTYLRDIAKPLAERDLQNPDLVFGHGPQHHLDWVGEILDLGLDGLLTIRFGGLPYREEVRVPWDRVLSVIDDEAGADFSLDGPVDHMEIDIEEEDKQEMSDESAIEETIEYEGGRRLDNESGEEEDWSTDEEDSSATPVPNGDINMVDGSNNVCEEEIQDRTKGNPHSTFSSQPQNLAIPIHPEPVSVPASKPKTSNMPQMPLAASNLLQLAAIQTEASASFLVLDTAPPPDQFLGPSPDVLASASPTFLKRITREHRILATSLPTNQIYIRAYESRLDLLRCLIIGPKDTPYEYAPFLIDLFLPPNYPTAPPIAHFHSWTSGLGRINPNLYEEGKICLSLLGTWPGRGQGEADTWSEKANILQVLVSLMGLVLVKKPFYNEAGFEGYEADGAYKVESSLYSEKAYVMARGFVKYALTNKVAGLEDALAWLYLPRAYSTDEAQGDPEDLNAGEGSKAALGNRPELLPKLIRGANALMDYSSSCTGDDRDELVDGAGKKTSEAFVRPLSQGAIVMLRRHLEALEMAFRVQA
jgi:ubiquitin-conjugating enzyme E2 O